MLLLLLEEKGHPHHLTKVATDHLRSEDHHQDEDHLLDTDLLHGILVLDFLQDIDLHPDTGDQDHDLGIGPQRKWTLQQNFREKKNVNKKRKMVFEFLRRKTAIDPGHVIDTLETDTDHGLLIG